MAAKLGQPAEAQYQLGHSYGYGWSLERWTNDSPEERELNKAASRAWFRLAAEQGHADAQFYLSRMLPNAKESLFWLRKAASQGHAEAQCNLGKIYLWSWDQQAFNYLEAIFWLQKAAAQGHAEAKRELGLWYSDEFMVPKDLNELRHWVREKQEKEAKSDLKEEPSSL